MTQTKIKVFQSSGRDHYAGNACWTIFLIQWGCNNYSRFTPRDKPNLVENNKVVSVDQKMKYFDKWNSKPVAPTKIFQKSQQKFWKKTFIELLLSWQTAMSPWNLSISPLHLKVEHISMAFKTWN